LSLHVRRNLRYDISPNVDDANVKRYARFSDIIVDVNHEKKEREKMEFSSGKKYKYILKRVTKDC